jgi:hypothetical protein
MAHSTEALAFVPSQPLAFALETHDLCSIFRKEVRHDLDGMKAAK